MSKNCVKIDRVNQLLFRFKVDLINQGHYQGYAMTAVVLRYCSIFIIEAFDPN